MSVKLHPCLICSSVTRNRVTCSKACASKRFEKPLVNCKQCGNSISKNFDKKNFCNHSCAAKFNNKGIVRNPYGNGGFIEGISSGRGNNSGGLAAEVKEPLCCSHCETILKSQSKKFCSSKCRGLYLKNKNIKAWLEDDSIHNGKDNLPHHIRDYLLAEAGYRCTVSSCGWGEVNQFTGRVPLEVDHVDGDAHNNSKDNLRVVCPQCHALSPFHRALNRKSSRVDRGRSSK